MIVVLGLGRETRELLRILERERPGEEVLVLDESTTADGERPEHPGLALRFRGGVDLDVAGTLPTGAERVFRSPGVSPYRPGIATAVAAGVPVTTPTGFWAERRGELTDVIAITGTKGKSTTAALTAHLLRAAGRTVSLRGNIGRPALLADGEPPADDVVLELSSYQLVDLEADMGLGAVTTLLRDHVPWHGSVERYHHDKLRLLSLTRRSIVTPEVAAALAARRLVRGTAAMDRAVRGSSGEVAPAGVASPTARATVRMALAAADLLGEHLVQDAELALALVDARLERPAGTRELIDSLADFRPLPHRLTPVGDHRGIRFVDDSISTVPESAVAAVRAYLSRGPVTVLLGGDDRGQTLQPLADLMRDERVRAVLLPPLAGRLEAELGPVAGDRLATATDLADAVARAVGVTPRGGSVVLSPAAPSFSSYRDFVARGEHFTALVTALG